jgi:inorganic phosphate transporter, PiT family
MTDLALNSPVGGAAPADPALRQNLDKGFNPLTMILFCGILAAGPLSTSAVSPTCSAYRFPSPKC